MHQCIDLKLSFIEYIRGGFLDIVVYHVPDTRIQADLLFRMRMDEIIVVRFCSVCKLCCFRSSFLSLITYLLGRKDRYVIFVDISGLCCNTFRVPLLFELLAGGPKEDVLLAVLATQEILEHFTAICLY